MEYPWPGNVRELQHTMERAVILSEGNVLKPTDFLLHSKPSQSFDTGPATLDEMAATNDFQSLGNSTMETIVLLQISWEFPGRPCTTK